jgi:hypothetical protein
MTTSFIERHPGTGTYPAAEGGERRDMESDPSFHISPAGAAYHRASAGFGNIHIRMPSLESNQH